MTAIVINQIPITGKNWSSGSPSTTGSNGSPSLYSHWRKEPHGIHRELSVLMIFVSYCVVSTCFITSTVLYFVRASILSEDRTWCCEITKGTSESKVIATADGGRRARAQRKTHQTI